MYIAGDHKVYPSDFDKINFVLSFMNSGEAAAWNKQFIEEQPNLENLDLGMWDDFKKNLKEAFSPYDVPGVLGDAPLRPMFPPIFLHHLCILLLIVASPRRSALMAPISESDDHVT